MFCENCTEAVGYNRPELHEQCKGHQWCYCQHQPPRGNNESVTETSTSNREGTKTARG